MKNALKNIKHFKLLRPAKNGVFFDTVTASRRNDKHLLKDRIVYSLLAFRSGIGKGASIREITRETTLHGTTVKKSLNHLGDLVRLQDGKWHANEPPEDCFVFSRDAKHWCDTFQYAMLYLPKQRAIFQRDDKMHRFGINHAVVFSYLVSLSKERVVSRFTVRGLCTMLHGMSEKTVNSVLNDLVNLKFIHRLCFERFSTITLLTLTDEHLALFEPKETTNANDTPKPVSPKEKNPLFNYEFKKDGLDKFREHCVGLMPQSQAEKAIAKAREFGFDEGQFMLDIQSAERRNSKNILDGKVANPNFGNYVNTILQTRVDERRKQNQALLVAEKAEEYRRSTAGQKAEEDRKKEIAENTLHPEHFVDANSIVSRVKLTDNPAKNRIDADRVISKVHRFCESNFTCEFSGVQANIDEVSRRQQGILRSALATFNKHYGREELATEPQLKIAINKAILNTTKGKVGPLFEDVENEMEMAHV